MAVLNKKATRLLKRITQATKKKIVDWAKAHHKDGVLFKRGLKQAAMRAHHEAGPYDKRADQVFKNAVYGYSKRNQ